jgi:hypothetical protein
MHGGDAIDVLVVGFLVTVWFGFCVGTEGNQVGKETSSKEHTIIVVGDYETHVRLR